MVGLWAGKLGLLAYCLLFSINTPRLSQHELESFSMKLVTKRDAAYCTPNQPQRGEPSSADRKCYLCSPWRRHCPRLASFPKGTHTIREVHLCLRSKRRRHRLGSGGPKSKGAVNEEEIGRALLCVVPVLCCILGGYHPVSQSTSCCLQDVGLSAASPAPCSACTPSCSLS
ncbi:uncharacterized protein LOC128115612 isoform X2 [Peromyscus californicus insignis]|uniref:uncharacterized protein LOC128115612 isoform X2 n=1 Tax=Peromyscus californicus insignis TaxID=564181 RepID=UPI0022A7481B|nr:uncharacterized protein LOC128115612 isoform X2 [Peromyscus californicus insignis]